MWHGNEPHACQLDKSQASCHRSSRRCSHTDAWRGARAQTAAWLWRRMCQGGLEARTQVDRAKLMHGTEAGGEGCTVKATASTEVQVPQLRQRRRKLWHSGTLQPQRRQSAGIGGSNQSLGPTRPLLEPWQRAWCGCSPRTCRWRWRSQGGQRGHLEADACRHGELLQVRCGSSGPEERVGAEAVCAGKPERAQRRQWAALGHSRGGCVAKAAAAEAEVHALEPARAVQDQPPAADAVLVAVGTVCRLTAACMACSSRGGWTATEA